MKSEQKLAAWLLMVPGPWAAASGAEALNMARKQFDPALSERAFADALQAAGFMLEAVDQHSFALRPLVSVEAA